MKLADFKKMEYKLKKKNKGRCFITSSDPPRIDIGTTSSNSSSSSSNNDDLLLVREIGYPFPYYNMILNHFICLIDYAMHTITTTRQRQVLTESAIVVAKKDDHPQRFKSYLLTFGFDSAANEHKLVCTLSSDAANYLICTLELQVNIPFRKRGSNPIPVCIMPFDLAIEKKKKDKKKQVRCIVTSADDLAIRTGSCSFCIDDDFLVLEILTRLRRKPLFRFKSVCKRWCSLIQQNQHFIGSNLASSKICRLLIVVPVPIPEVENETGEVFLNDFCVDRWPYQEFYITADLVMFEEDDIRVVVDRVREVDSSSYNRISKPINGLICHIFTEIEGSARICNINTGELSPWFESSLLSGEKYCNGVRSCRMSMRYSVRNCNYQFGFDPATNKHKLVCVWAINNPYGFICEVLTVGGGSQQGWRRIEEVPTDDITHDSVYVNGIIYWSSYHLMEYGGALGRINWRPPEWNKIVTFDVGNEKFETIMVPESIIDQPREHFHVNTLQKEDQFYSNSHGHLNLLQVDGHLAMLIRMNRSLFKMYIYEEDVDDDYDNNKGRWREVTSITLPFCLGEDERCRFHTFAGSDDKIILTKTPEDCVCSEEEEEWKKKKKKHVSFYSYNWKKDSWTEFEVSGIPSSVPHLCTESFFATSLETILPP